MPYLAEVLTYYGIEYGCRLLIEDDVYTFCTIHKLEIVTKQSESNTQVNSTLLWLRWEKLEFFVTNLQQNAKR